ncbi:MAG: Arm DNA-binding domain-containing protein [Alteraurantiacibacter sp. bin_em_oilr2.035]|nr:Arm DNA-binding domain-containing protein [Alteraurantiacibacter sp. bin_em_oilr2.035]
MPLTDVEIRSLKPKAKSYKRADAKGLYVEVFPNGSKLWRFKYRMAGKEKRLALGAYPEIKLTDARRRRDEARAKVGQGIDPALERKREKAAAKISAHDSFERIAEEYIEKMVREGRAASSRCYSQPSGQWRSAKLIRNYCWPL